MRGALSVEVRLTTGGASKGCGKVQLLLPVRAAQQIWMPSPCYLAQPPMGWRRLHRYYRHRDLRAACRSHSLRAPVAPQDRDVAGLIVAYIFYACAGTRQGRSTWAVRWDEIGGLAAGLLVTGNQPPSCPIRLKTARTGHTPR
ncbi:hypothetical protein SCH4B_0258 [Ruegeria sp. TrichCH4B]|nr:hypothetical protein SCH4B_0258 [Ruegeria sp. TrichCH4B]